MTTMLTAAVLLLGSGSASAQEIQVRTDSNGVETFTNVPASQRKAKRPAADKHGVQLYKNVRSSSVDKAEAAPEPSAPPLASLREDPVQEPPPLQAAPSQLSAPVADGQWVYTQQYGWVWMPYGGQYVSEGESGDADPYAYVYEPSSGWGWLAAPWVWGWGTYPYFGALGPGRLGWYRGLVHAGYGWGGYRGGGLGRGGFARGFAGGGYREGFRGGYGRGGFGGHGVGGGHFGAPARRQFSGGGGFSGGHGGGGRGGGGHGGGGRGGGGRR